MKIAINRCYGGFSLSAKALKRMADLRGEDCFFFIQEGFRGKYIETPIEELENKWSWTAFKVKNPDDYFNFEKFAESAMADRQKQNENFTKVHVDSRPDDRTDPIMIQAIEELGSEANGSCAEIKIIEIPDGIEWEISEYDGMEKVEQIHQSWS